MSFGFNEVGEEIGEGEFCVGNYLNSGLLCRSPKTVCNSTESF